MSLLYAVITERCWHFWRMDRMYYWIVAARKEKSFCYQCDAKKIVPKMDPDEGFFQVYRSTGSRDWIGDR